MSNSILGSEDRKVNMEDQVPWLLTKLISGLSDCPALVLGLKFIASRTLDSISFAKWVSTTTYHTGLGWRGPGNGEHLTQPACCRCTVHISSVREVGVHLSYHQIPLEPSMLS